MSFIILNGKLIPEETPAFRVSNRGLRYGDGVFETIKYKKGSLLLFENHLERMWQGMRLLRFSIPKLFTPALLEEKTLQLLHKNGLDHARIRITVTRGVGGLYEWNDDPFHYSIECWPLQESTGIINENGLDCCFFEEIPKNTGILSNCKHNNFLVYAMGALFAKKEKCNDAIILNQNKNIADTTIANLFLIKDKTIFTPTLTEGPIAGVMRAWLIKELKNEGFEIREEMITEEMLMNADEVFLTNSIYNIRWVSSIGDKNYSLNNTLEIYNLLMKTKSTIFC